MTAAETLARYRSRHRIAVRPAPNHEYHCEVDGIRVLATRDGRWRHDPDRIIKLLEEQYGGPFGAPKATATR
jgi:hypothetical protein